MNLNLFENREKKSNDFAKELIQELKSTLENNKLQNNTEELNQAKDNSLKQENCLYQVVEITANGAYLQNINNNRISEETDIPSEVLNQIEEDSVLKFKDGHYSYEEELTEKFRSSLIGVKEYRDIKQKFINESNISEINPNTKFKIESYKDDYCLLSYENEKTIEVPKALIPFWAKDGDILYYKNEKFERNLND